MQTGLITDDIRIASSHSDGPWVLGRGALFKVEQETLSHRIDIDEGFNAFSVQALLENSRGEILVGTRSSGTKILSLSPGRSDIPIETPGDVAILFEDRSGNIWAGSNGGGLARVSVGMLRRFDRLRGLLEDYVLSICEDNSGRIWLANRDAGVAFITPQGRVRTLPSPNVSDTFSARAVVPFGTAGVWVATSHGVLRAEGTSLLPLGAPDAPPQSPDHGEMRVTHICRNGDFWVALSPGRIGLLRNGSWRVFDAREGLRQELFRAIAEDSHGNVWVGCDGGLLYKFDGARFAPVALPGITEIGGIQAIHFNQHGVGWIGTVGAGLIRLDSQVVQTLDETTGLPTNKITQVITDDIGNLWCGSPEGIFCIKGKDLDQFFRGDVRSVDVIILGQDEELGDVTCASAHQPSVWKSRNGLVWFATRQGVVAIDPARESSTLGQLLVTVDALRCDGNSRSFKESAEIPSRTRTVEFDYSVLCLSTPERVRTLIRLRGYEDDWTEPEVKGKVRYSKLPPGKYTLEIESHVAGSTGTASVMSLPLVVESAWWQTLWFKVGGIVSVLTIGVMIVRALSHRRLRAELAQLEHVSALERERARIAQNIHDDLGSGLTRISLLTLTPEVGGERTQLTRIFHLVGDLIRSMDEVVWAVNPKNDNLENFANYLIEFAQDFLRDAKIRCRIISPEILPLQPLSTQCRHHLYLSSKETLNNVVKHANASEVILEIRTEADWFVVSISDNGRGIRARASTDHSSMGNGISNMESRMVSINGSCEIESDEAGTLVTFRVPILSH
ncbi:MAG: two-component regulator propeller domain-containing protein [Nibricoccus sp.]